MAFTVIRLNDMLNAVGEEFVKELFSDFSCPVNEDVESFLKEKAIMFQGMDVSRTYLVFTSYKGENVFVGYFALALKILPIRKGVSPTQRNSAGPSLRYIEWQSTNTVATMLWPVCVSASRSWNR